MEEDFVLERDYKMFHLAVQTSKGYFRSTADGDEDVDLDAGTLISSGESRTENMMGKTLPSVTAVFRHCVQLANGVKISTEVVNTLLCDPSQSAKFKFFLPQNVFGLEHYNLRMDQAAEYLPTPPS